MHINTCQISWRETEISNKLRSLNTQNHVYAFQASIT